MPEISVLMPVYNSQLTVSSAIKSIIGQTFINWELVIVDDGSYDNSLSIIKSFADKRIKIISIPHKGLIHALNTGLASCQGNWIVRMDSDDISCKNRLEALVKHASENPDVSVIGSHVMLFPKKDLKKGMIRYESWLNSIITHDDISRNIMVECPIAHPALMLKRKTFLEVGGYIDNVWPEDYDLIFRLFLNKKLFSLIPDKLLMWRYHNNKTSMNKSRYSRQKFFDIKYYYFKKIFDVKKRKIVLAGCGEYGREWLSLLIKDGFNVAAVLDIKKRNGDKIFGINILNYKDFDVSNRYFFISTVGTEGAREKIRNWLTIYGIRELKDFVCVA